MREVVKLGQLLGSSEQRDAVHVAVLPCYTDEMLEPGQDVGITIETDDSSHREIRASCVTPHVGIVDPFLTHPVGPKHRFYVMLYPNTIESLRHEWRHPLIDGVVESKPDAEASERWLRMFIHTFDSGELLPLTYEDLMLAATTYALEGKTTLLSYFPPRSYYNNEVIREFWKHYGVVTGAEVKDLEAKFFVCSC